MKKILMMFILLFLVGACSSDYQLKKMSDEIVFTPGTMVDALFVLDTSCSMNNDAERVLVGAVTAGSDLWSMELDARLAYTTTSPDQITWEEVDMSQDLSSIVVDSTLTALTLPSDDQEAGFISSMNAADEHPGFFRDEAITLIVLVSDEHEQSEISTEEFVDFWGYPSYIVSVAGEPEEFISETEVDQYGFPCKIEATPKYYDSADLRLNICEDSPWRIQDVLPK